MGWGVWKKIKQGISKAINWIGDKAKKIKPVIDKGIEITKDVLPVLDKNGIDTSKIKPIVDKIDGINLKPKLAVIKDKPNTLPNKYLNPAVQFASHTWSPNIVN